MYELYYTLQTAVTYSCMEKKSRFTTNLLAVKSKSDAIEHLRTIAAKEIGANHNCYAYIIGNPASPEIISCSDDGEPAGTAGKPLLNILLHNKFGNVLVVVTRYFGGIKLGSGGLVRAYSHGLKMALQDVVLKEYIESVELTISFHYQFEGNIRQVCKENGAVIVDTQYKEEARFHLQVGKKKAETLIAQLENTTSGQIKLKYRH